MYQRFTDAKLISYLLQCHSAIFFDKNLNICHKGDMQGLEKLFCNLWKMWQSYSSSKSRNFITDLCSSSLESMVALP